MGSHFSISLIIPVKNRRFEIIRTLNSIARQQTLPERIIIVDNNSTDSTLDAVNDWISTTDLEGTSISITSELKPGASAARNKGLAEADTKYVMFFDSDDEMRPDHIDRIAKRLTSDGSIDLLFFDLALIDEDGWTETKSVTDTNFLRGHIFHSSLSTDRFAATTELARKAGGWDESLPSWNDLEFGVRLLLNSTHTAKLYGEPRVVAHHSEISISTTPLSESGPDKELSLSRIYDTLSSSGNQLALKWVQARRIMLAAQYAREGLKERGRELFAQTIADVSLPDAFKLRLIYNTVRAFGRGGAALATFFFKEPSPKNKG